MKVQKNGHAFEVSGVQLRAFLSSGYELVEKPKDGEKQNPKGDGKKTTKPKGQKPKDGEK